MKTTIRQQQNVLKNKKKRQLHRKSVRTVSQKNTNKNYSLAFFKKQKKAIKNLREIENKLFSSSEQDYDKMLEDSILEIEKKYGSDTSIIFKKHFEDHKKAKDVKSFLDKDKEDLVVDSEICNFEALTSLKEKVVTNFECYPELKNAKVTLQDVLLYYSDPMYTYANYRLLIGLDKCNPVTDMVFILTLLANLRYRMETIIDFHKYFGLEIPKNSMLDTYEQMNDEMIDLVKSVKSV
jgi:hypothetical protein